MQNEIKEVPLQYMTPEQFVCWTASIGFSGTKEAHFLDDALGGDVNELIHNQYHWGKADLSTAEYGLERLEVDKLALETRRALHKMPAFQEDSEYMVLLSEHWETRLDENILKTEFKVRRTRAAMCGAYRKPSAERSRRS